MFYEMPTADIAKLKSFTTQLKKNNIGRFAIETM